MTLETIRMVADLILPPGGLLVLLAFGLLMWLFRLRKFAAFCILLGTVLMYFASTPYIARQLLDPLQYQYEVLKEIPADAQAIVVLSGGRLPIAREYDNLDIVKASTLERLRYASRLAKIAELPILLVGGSVNGERQSEAVLMKHALETDFGVQVKWLEEEGRTTLENVKFAKEILNENSISKFLLVTHAYHMPRAVWSFNHFGLNPTPAPTIFYKRNTNIAERRDYIPQASALARTKLALHERIGNLWYQYIED